MHGIEVKIDQWKKRLLDLGKRNRLINFKETKRSNIAIVSPDYEVLYDKIVNEEAKLSFSFPLKTTFDEDGEEINLNIEKGDLETNKTLNEQQKTLKVLRARAKTSIEEQGINTLYLAFGLVRWKESDVSDVEISSPIILVPVTLTIESMTDPYILQLHEDEIVVNPSLSFKFENDFGINLPEFDGHEDSIIEYFSRVEAMAKKNDWEVVTDVNLTLLSFLKINMYKDLDANKDKIVSNPIVKALSGDKSEISIIPDELNDYDHDRNTRPIDTYQVVDADSSQQDAILLSKQGISFVLQGPPGTGKSQTITNIIAETISDGKKVLFVSEKMAALEVVKKRLTEAGLDDFCLTLHSYKANKKEILNQLAKTLNTQRINVREDAIYKLSVLEERRKKLNEYHLQLHQKCAPLNLSIYEANGRLAKLSDTQDIIFEIDNVENTDTGLLNKYKYLLEELSKTIGKLNENYSENPWYGCNVPVVTHELRHDIEVTLSGLIIKIKGLIELHEEIINRTGTKCALTINNLSSLNELLDFTAKSPRFPFKWLSENISDLLNSANEYARMFSEYKQNRTSLLERYNDEIFKLHANDIVRVLESSMVEVTRNLDNDKYPSTKEIVLRADYILSECQETKKFLQELVENSKPAVSILGIEEIHSIGQTVEIQKLIKLVIKEPQPLPKWFNLGQIKVLNTWLEKSVDEQNVLYENEKVVGEKFNEDICNINIEKIISCFENSYPATLRLISNFNGSSDYNNLTLRNLYSFSTQVETVRTYFLIVKNALQVSNELANNIKTRTILALGEFVDLSEFLSAIIQNPKPTLAWFDDNKELVIDKLIAEIKSAQAELQQETKELLTKYNKDILNIDYKNILIRFNTEYTNFLKFFKGTYYNDKKIIKGFVKDNSLKLSDADMASILNKIATIKDKEQWLTDKKMLASELLGSHYMEEYTNWDLLDNSRTNFKVIKNYFKSAKIPQQVQEILLNCDVENLIPAHSNIVKVDDANILSFLENIFGSNITKKSVVELLDDMEKSSDVWIEIKNTCEEISSYSKTANGLDELTIKDLIGFLTAIKLVNEKREWFSKNEDALLAEFGKYYSGVTTDWDNVKWRIEITEQIIGWFSKEVPDSLKNHLVFPGNQETIEKLDNTIEAISSNNIVERLDGLLKGKHNQNSVLEGTILLLNNIEDALNSSYNKYIDFSSCAKNELQFETIMTDIVLLNALQEIEEKVKLQTPELSTDFDFMFQNMETNWDNVICALEYANQFSHLCEEYSLSHDFISSVCNQSICKWSQTYSEKVKEQACAIKNDFDWYANLFEDSNRLKLVSLYELLGRIESSINNLSSLEEWIDFRSSRQQCREIGLSDFVTKVEQENMRPEIIVNTFLKRFYRLWLDAMIPLYPAVYSFRSRSHLSLIGEFNELDKTQLQIARLRILERLISRLPNTNSATSSVDEVGILKRELTKQRKIMPLRKLFKAIPNLLTALKPCLMMSPLSVSLFLQADGYNFDTIIFDEASQVCTEDAIGAIMRGKQVIIAGDSKQLPPTSFFAASLSDSDFDNDSEEESDDTGAYDSILEEAVITIPERTLKWHYRSRHEHLIAFSNTKIYNNELITFPSNMDKIPDNGVEYIYVEDGVYDRGGKKHNLNEAKRVAKLVFSHFSKYPNRSLGVVTFSEAQQQAVDSAIRQLRLQNSQYEKFFSEDSDQEFFIKNLENVQGDERDTIIFSIGYAKDPNGIMYMNFGPLSRNGGYRRLNVAITRAKYNVKLVGSIHPTDIKIENTNSEGVKMLRQYIEFAINGDSVLQNELQYNNSVDVESPFEEAVYDFLIKNGYNVKTQVGCSGYRIDMAIKHPTLSGIFVLGVECDGATYHSARTARERDRIRQTVLEDIGWKIYRIWSTDWIKDPKTEGEKLLEAVKIAISNYKNGEVEPGSDKHEEIVEKDELSIREAYVRMESPKLFSDDNFYDFSYYQETDIYKIPKVSNYETYLTDTINYVVKEEAPIHFELLCKRVAPLFGNQKVTAKVKNWVESIINSNLKNVVTEKDNFVWHKKNNAIKVRIPSVSGEGRVINYISTEELEEAMVVIAGKSFGISKNDLYIIVARAFGFSRTGSSIIQAMETACSQLLDNGRLRDVDGKIVL